MQIDFHHCATYVIARFSGFAHADSSTIAHAAQYVDDSTTSGFIRFANGMRYQRWATAHPMSDPDNLDNDENTTSWLPFHFLPGDDAVGANPVLGSDYVRKLVCRPDSEIAKRMMAGAQAARDCPHGLHRLGIAAHVFIDTFAHQGFAGLHHPINRASELRDGAGQTIDALPVPPIGHGQVGTCPDQPYLVWSYTDWQGRRIERDNPADFLRASQRLCEEFQRYRQVPVTGMTAAQTALIEHAIGTIRDPDGARRHAQWLALLAADRFALGAQQLDYEGGARGSWKQLALGEAYVQWLDACKRKLAERVSAHGDSYVDRFLAFSGKEVQTLLDKTSAAADALGRDTPIECGSPSAFLDSDYKRFHDAAREQRNLVLGELLPRAGIYAS